jgi:hypothetical protein
MYTVMDRAENKPISQANQKAAQTHQLFTKYDNRNIPFEGLFTL